MTDIKVGDTVRYLGPARQAPNNDSRIDYGDFLTVTATTEAEDEFLLEGIEISVSGPKFVDNEGFYLSLDDENETWEVL